VRYEELALSRQRGFQRGGSPLTPEGLRTWILRLTGEIEARALGHSNAKLHGYPLPRASYQPAGLAGALPGYPVGSLIFRRASHLDAFSAYPFRTSATRRCAWRHNRYTGGPSIPVLSY